RTTSRRAPARARGRGAGRLAPRRRRAGDRLLGTRGAIPRATSLGLSAEGFVAETCSGSTTAAFRLRALDENPGARSRDGLRHGLLALHHPGHVATLVGLA